MLFSYQDVETLERQFSQNRYDGNLENPNYFDYIKGKIPVLISAPHTTNHCKDGAFKLSDAYTGSLALLLQRFTGAHVIYLTKQAMRNPNGEPSSEYKDKIKEICETEGIKLVLDLHGSARHRPFDIDFGTSEGATISKEKLKELWEVFFAHGIIELTENFEFKAPFPTITNYTGVTLGIPSVQLEINRNFRSPDEDFFSFQLLVESIIEIIRRNAK